MPLALPTYQRFGPYKLDPARGLLVASGSDVMERSLDGQTFLRVCKLDLEDPGAISAFVNTYGPMRIGLGYDTKFNWLARFIVNFDPLRPTPGFRNTGLCEQVFGRREREEIRDVDWLLGESLDEFRFGAGCVADLTTAWKFLTGELDRDSISWRLPLIFHRWTKTEDSVHVSPTPEITVEAAEGMLSRGLSAALHEFSPRVIGGRDPYASHPAPGKRGITGWQELHEPNSSLYLLCCLELFNLIARGADWRECANETCDKGFIPHPDYGRHRDSIYCTPRCKNTQWRRHSRRIKRSSPSGSNTIAIT
jgi:hypothetical protein